MIKNNFALYVPEGKEEDGIVVIEHGKQYTIVAKNGYSDRRCEAEIWVDGKKIETFLINANGDLRLERPVNEDGKFTFFISDSTEAKAVGIKKGDSDNGKIEVIFTPEKYKPRTRSLIDYDVVYDGHVEYSMSDSLEFSGEGLLRACSIGTGSGSFVEGATALTGKSNQKFHTVDPIDGDKDLRAVLTLKLVGEQKGLRPLKGKNDEVMLTEA